MSQIEHEGQTAGTRWNPGQYLRFSDHRLRPALELMERIPLEAPGVICDLGCGTGNITRLMAKRWPSASVYGLDNSQEMLRKAKAGTAAVNWIEADIGSWSPERTPDLIYSNAALHWVEGHHNLFPRLIGFLSAGGCLAVQMPLSWDLPSHRLMRQTLADGGAGGRPLGTEKLRQTIARRWVEDGSFYYDLLTRHAVGLDIWETAYLQVLDGNDAVLEWVRGTGLHPIVDGLTVEERKIFLAEYRRRLREAYPVKPDGRTLYPFRRLFIVAVI